MSDKLFLRKAREDDVFSVLEISNDKEVRRFSYNSQEIKLDEHKIWFNNIINDKNCLLLICQLNDNIVGQIRYDIKNDIAVIGISLKSNCRGMGIGKTVFVKSVDILQREYPSVRKIVAYIKKINEISIRYFKKINFSFSKELVIKNCDSVEYVYKIDRNRD